MNNINTQVSPRNGVDFSKIRKAQKGIRIPKFLSPYQKLDLTEDEYNTRRNIYAAKEDFFTDGQYDYAKMYEYYKAHPEQFKDLTLITASPTWDNAKRNSTGFADWNSQFNDTGLNYFFGYDASKADYFGPTTSARKGFLEYIKAQEAVLPDINSSENNKRDLPESDQPEEVDEETDNISGDYTPDDYYNFQFKSEPFLTPNPFLAGLSLAANKHQYDNEMQKKVTLLGAPYRQYITGSYKATVDAYNNAGADIQSKANRIASQTSNLEQSQATQLQGAEMATNKQLEGALKLQEGYNQDRENLLNTAYFNSEAANRIANQNRINLAADWNRRLDAKSKYQLARNNIKYDFINKTWTDYQQWAANEKNERDAALMTYNDYMANLGIQHAMKPYYDLASDPMKSRSFATIYQNAYNDFESNRGDNAWLKSNKALEDIFGNNDLDQNAKNQAFMDYLRTSNSDYATAFTKGFTAESEEAKNKAIAARQRIQNYLASLQPSFRNTYIGGWGPWDTRHLGKKWALFDKNGGILKMKRGSRFVDYLEHNRKAIKDQKQTTMEVSKQAERLLKTLLESLDRETLILLRSIFK